MCLNLPHLKETNIPKKWYNYSFHPSSPVFWLLPVFGLYFPGEQLRQDVCISYLQSHSSIYFSTHPTWLSAQPFICKCSLLYYQWLLHSNSQEILFIPSLAWSIISIQTASHLLFLEIICFLGFHDFIYSPSIFFFFCISISMDSLSQPHWQHYIFMPIRAWS